MTDALELAALRERLHIAREAHRAAVAELERLERKRSPRRASAFALQIARRRAETARIELAAARRALLRLV